MILSHFVVPLKSDLDVQQTRPRNLGPFSHHFIFFTTYEWAQQARVLHNTLLERLANNKNSSLLGPFVS